MCELTCARRSQWNPSTKTSESRSSRWSRSSHCFVNATCYTSIHQSASIRPRFHQTWFRTVENTPELYRFTLATYECDPTLVYDSLTILSREGPQQGDPLSSLEIFESIQPILNELDSDLEIGFIDDLSMSSDLLTLAKKVETIVNAETYTGLKLNTAKCEIIMDDFTDLDSFHIFKDFIRIPEDKMTLLGAPILQGQALDEALQIKVDKGN